jgi:hypothetical protein
MSAHSGWANPSSGSRPIAWSDLTISLQITHRTGLDPFGHQRVRVSGRALCHQRWVVVIIVRFPVLCQVMSANTHSDRASVPVRTWTVLVAVGAQSGFSGRRPPAGLGQRGRRMPVSDQTVALGAPAQHATLVVTVGRFAMRHLLVHRRRARQQLAAGGEVAVRPGFPDDWDALERLAELDSVHLPRGPMLLAEVGDELRAALCLADGTVLADPFYPTAELIELLRERAVQLSA